MPTDSKDADNTTTEKVPRLHRMAGATCAWLLPAATQFLNYRIGHYDLANDPARPEYDEHCIYVFWHEYITSVLPKWGRTPLTLLVSQSRDAEVLNEMALGLGLNIVRGSTTRGGSRAIRELKRYSKTSSIAISPDGPLGPRREMAMGAIYLASLLKMPIVPVGIGVSKAWRLKTWDQFSIPKPFARVRVIFGPKYYLPPRSKKHQLEKHRLITQTRLEQLTEVAEQWAVSGDKLEGAKRFCRGRRKANLYLEPKTREQLISLARNEAA